MQVFGEDPRYGSVSSHLLNEALISNQEAYQEATRQMTQKILSIQLASLSTINRAPCKVEFFRYSSITRLNLMAMLSR